MSALTIAKLTIQDRVDPIGIDQIPYFSWCIKSSEMNNYQLAYQLQVRKMDNCITPLQELIWDSGLVESDKQAYIEYAGEKLDSFQGYQVELKVIDKYHHQAQAKACFETAFMDKSLWKAKWIETDFRRDEYSFAPFWPLKSPVLFIKNFELLDKQIVRARLYASAHGVYRPYLNGERIDEREFAPEHTVYEKILYYQTYELTNLSKENTIAFYVGDGWYNCKQTLQDIKGYNGLPGVIFQIQVDYQDGQRQIIFSDGKESCQLANIVYSDLYIGEKQDYNLNNFKKYEVKLGEYNLDNLLAQNMDPIEIVERISAKQIYISEKGETIVDFGQIIAGRAQITVNLPKGKEATFEYFEVCDKEGNYLNTVIAPQKEIYVSDGKTRVFESVFSFHGFRYIRVTGIENTNKEDFTAVLLSSKKENIGSFFCDDQRINRLYKNIRYSQTNNMLSIPTDCPSREKAGFTGDIQIYCKSAMLNENMTPFLNSWLLNLTAAQADNGSIPITVPETLPYKNLMIKNEQDFDQVYPQGCAGWSDAAIIVPYTMYELTGNELILVQQYPSMKKWCDHIVEIAKSQVGNKDNPQEVEKYLWDTGFHFGEWLIPSDPNTIGHVDACKGSAYYVAPIFGYISLSLMHKVASILNKTEADYYGKIAEKMKQAIQYSLIKDKQLISKNMGAYVLMLYFDLVPEELVSDFQDKLITILKENNYCLNTGFLTTPYLLDTFSKMGRDDLAIKILMQDKMPSWLYEVDNGATAIWEAWNSIKPKENPSIGSYDHYAYGCVDGWIFENVAGIKPIKPGFKEILIAPKVEELPFAFCQRSYLSNYGEIEVDWTKDKLRVNIPFGVKANILWKQNKYVVGSGKYEFI